jgi:hypothetical protein
MKKFLKGILSISCIALLFFASCAEEEEILPDVDPRLKFVGVWNVAETLGGTPNPGYQSVVTTDTSNTSRILIANFYNLGPTVLVKAIVAGNSLSLDQAEVSGIPISGGGTYSNNSFVLNFTANEGDGPMQVSATYTR